MSSLQLTLYELSFATTACRQKKCKCNRALPVCSSCTADPSKCWYSQGSKRGIPAGYINSLETRLAETEAALYYALCELHSGYREQGSYGPLAEHLKQRYGHGKTDMAKEWRELPMTSREQAQTWWLQRELDICGGHRPSSTQPRRHSSRNLSYGNSALAAAAAGGGGAMVPVVQMQPQSSISWQQYSPPDVQFQDSLNISAAPPGASHFAHQQGALHHNPFGQQSIAAAASLREVHSTHYDTDPRQRSGYDHGPGPPSTTAGEQVSGKARALAEDQSSTYF